jgi:hypothetical protein
MIQRAGVTGYGNTSGQTEHSGGESTITRESFMEFVNITAQTALSRVDTITCTENYMDFWNTVGLMVFRNLNLIFSKLYEGTN